MSFWESLSSLDDDDVEELLSRYKPAQSIATNNLSNDRQLCEEEDAAPSLPMIKLITTVASNEQPNGTDSKNDNIDSDATQEDSFSWDSFDDCSDLEEEFLKTNDSTHKQSSKNLLDSMHNRSLKKCATSANQGNTRKTRNASATPCQNATKSKHIPKILLRSIHSPSTSPTKVSKGGENEHQLLQAPQNNLYGDTSIRALKVIPNNPNPTCAAISNERLKKSKKDKGKLKEININCKKPKRNKGNENLLSKVSIRQSVKEELDNIDESFYSFKTLSDDSIPEAPPNDIAEKAESKSSNLKQLNLERFKYNADAIIISTVSDSDPTSPPFHRYATTSNYQQVDNKRVFGHDVNNKSFNESKYDIIEIETPTKADTGMIQNEISFESPQIVGKANTHAPKIIDSSQSQENIYISQKEIVLSEEQKRVLEIIKSGHNVFYTGSAGTGKSVLLRELISQLREKYSSGQVAVCASTGLAACNIGGITVHSFAGIGLGEGELKKVVQRVRRNKKSVERWKSVKVWIIDEISMIEGKLLDKLDRVARSIRKVEVPFGGIQVIFCGDFYQLPPVKKNYYRKNENKADDFIYAFESSSWKEAIKIQVILTKVFRQQADSEFICMLNEMRDGRLSQATISNFMKLSRPLSGSDGLEAAELFSTRKEVENANNVRLKMLSNCEYVFNSIDGGFLTDQDAKEKILSNFLSPKQLILKKNCQVMIIKNMAAENLVNGSLGKVLTFIDKYTLNLYQTIIDIYSEEFSNADRITKVADNLVNVVLETANKKSKKAPLPRKFNFANLPASKTRDSTKKDDDTNNKTLLEVNSYNESHFEKEIDEEVFDAFRIRQEDPSITEKEKLYIETIRTALNKVYAAFVKFRLPYVRFLGEDGISFNRLISPESWKIDDENEVTLVERVQLPLMLAWAISIHKSQGQTLTKVKVDLRRVFEKGQAYVAISRATSRSGLQVLNFNPQKVMYDVKVEHFYKGLMDVNTAVSKAEELASHPAFISRKFFNYEPPTKKHKKK